MNKIDIKKHPLSFILRILVILAAAFTFIVLLFLIFYILVNGVPNLTAALFSLKYTSENLSLLPELINTLIMVILSLLIAIPIGVFSAIYLVEYSNRGSKLVKLIRITADTLSGIPSIVYGLFGMLFFSKFLGWSYSMMAGACTMAIMVLPLVLRTTEEALQSVSDTFREGSFGLGAGKLRTVFKIILPAAMPGILSGVILSMGRIMGETAALIYTSGTITQIATNVMDSGRTLALHMYVLAGTGLHIKQAYATAVVLLFMAVLVNFSSEKIAKKLSKGGA